MTTEEILTKAIEKAIDNGWDYLTFIAWDEKWEPPARKARQVMAEFYEMYSEAEDSVFEIDLVYKMIFKHDFAEALWGDKQEYIISIEETLDGTNMKSGGYEEAYSIYAWEFHLQQMIIADDPIKYLGENIG